MAIAIVVVVVATEAAAAAASAVRSTLLAKRADSDSPSRGCDAADRRRPQSDGGDGDGGVTDAFVDSDAERVDDAVVAGCANGVDDEDDGDDDDGSVVRHDSDGALSVVRWANTDRSW